MGIARIMGMATRSIISAAIILTVTFFLSKLFLYASTKAQIDYPNAGKPWIWYYQYPDGKCDFYNKPGYHPIIGELLKPATEQIYSEWHEENNRSGLISNTDPGKREISDKEKRLQEFKVLINPTASILRGKRNIALVIDAPKTGIDISSAATLYNILKSDNVHIVSDFLNAEEFKSKGYFNEFFNGNTEILNRSGALSKIDDLILGKITYSFRNDTPIDRSLISCDVNFHYKRFNKNGIVKDESLNVIGAGFSEEGALKRGLEILSERYADKILKSV